MYAKFQFSESAWSCSQDAEIKKKPDPPPPPPPPQIIFFIKDMSIISMEKEYCVST